MSNTLLGAAIRGAVAERVSSLFVFDLWIDNCDRNNHGNVIYGIDPDLPSRSGFVGLDHSLSMGARQTWANRGWQEMARPPFPDALSRAFDKSVMRTIAERIATLPDTHVTECAHRIPPSFLGVEERREILDGLLGRKKRIQAFVAQNA